jgi:hypothetical protein
MNKIKIFLKVIILVIITIMPFSCKSKEQVVNLYYRDPQAMYLIPVSTTMKLGRNNLDNVEDPEQILPLLDELAKSRGDKSLISCILPGIKFKDIEIKKDAKEIDLTIDTEKKRLGDKDEEMLIGALVNTLTDLNGFNSVKINPGNLQTDMDYSEPITREAWLNMWYMGDELNEKNALAIVYWYTKDKKYYVPVTVSIPKNDVSTLLSVLKKGPQGNRKAFLEPSINPSLDIIIKAGNMNNIDIELKSKRDLAKSIYDDSKKAVLLTISELKIFETVKFITPFAEEEIIDLKKVNPKKDLNRIEFFVGNAKE